MTNYARLIFWFTIAGISLEVDASQNRPQCSTQAIQDYKKDLQIARNTEDFTERQNALQESGKRLLFALVKAGKMSQVEADIIEQRRITARQFCLNTCWCYPNFFAAFSTDWYLDDVKEAAKKLV